MKPVAALLVPLLLLAAVPAAGGPKGTVFKVRTLSVRDRLALPWFRTPVGPDRALALLGRKSPVAFRSSAEGLVADATAEEGFETPIREGCAVAVELDAAGEEEAPRRHLAFVPGNPRAGLPGWAPVDLDVLVGAIGGERVFFVDFDGDGTWLTPWTDFLVREKHRDLFPVAPTVVLGRKAWRVEYDESERRVTAAPDREFVDRKVFPSWAGVAAGLTHLNEIRGKMNIPPVGLSRETSRKVMAHIRYLSLNGGNGHLEEEGDPGYSRDGVEAGVNSIGSMNLGGVPSTIDGHLSSLLHRQDLIDPRITEIGIGVDSGRVWIWTESARKRRWEGQGPIVFPGPRRSWHIGTYSGENPDPRPESGKTSGLPITVAWYGQEDPVRKVRVALRGPRGPIKCWKNDADRHDLETNHPQIRAVLMPLTSLTSGTHRLTIEWLDGEEPRRLDYAFRIGKW